MASPANPQHEPTMEEILASIRKIISEDSTDNPVAAPAAAPVPVAPAPRQEADVLELTQEVREEPRPAPVAAFASAPVQAAPAPQVVSPLVAESDVVFVSNEESPVSSPARADTSDNDSIFSDKSRKAIDDAFASLDAADEPRAAAAPARAMPSLAPVDGNSVEAVFERAVREAVTPLLNQWMDSRKDDLLGSVKPMIREWMDEHFPAILEGAVRDEVARVVKARGRR